ncbi:glycosyltransferase [Algibacter mikhailovii]|uniref:glycosyltransferase n=1 Tax=Algibacter mikhailovii TaxID=425498 RepID=UPI002495641F|nr:glycosyltransferase [Algibacter mikhailovii]
MTKKKKIVFVLPSLVSGGAERVMSFVAKNISKDHFDASLWVAGYEKKTNYDVSGLKVVYFNKPRVLKAIPSFYSHLNKTKPDIVISSISHLNTAMGLLSIFYPKTKFIGREANVQSVRSQYQDGKKNRAFNIIPFKKMGYNFLDLILCQSKDMYKDMNTNYSIPKKKLRVINNPITDDFKLKHQDLAKDNVPQFITVARLKKQKGHERIIKALSQLSIPYKYTIIGDGPEYDNLFGLISKLGLKDYIEHIPHTNEVSKYLSKSDFFLQGSYVEGFPNCLIESCSVGTPIIAYKAPGGLNEIIDEGVNGLVADNDEEFIDNILEATSKINWSAKKVSESVFKKFNKEKILSEYEQLFMDILK